MIGIILLSSMFSLLWMKQKLPIYVLEYLDWLKAFSTEEDNYKHIYEGASPDTCVEK
jgi:hypothetical protein